jgi:hypothetical protein
MLFRKRLPKREIGFVSVRPNPSWSNSSPIFEKTDGVLAQRVP